MALSEDHVKALNLVEIEFHRDAKVMAALRTLMAHFENGYGENKTLDELKLANDKSDALRTTLLSSIAKALKYDFEQMDILQGGYPKAFRLQPLASLPKEAKLQICSSSYR